MKAHHPLIVFYPQRTFQHLLTSHHVLFVEEHSTQTFWHDMPKSVLRIQQRRGQFLTLRNTGSLGLIYRSTRMPYLPPREDGLQPLKGLVYYTIKNYWVYMLAINFKYFRKQLLRRWTGGKNMMIL